jgi:hypothetical protein
MRAECFKAMLETVYERAGTPRTDFEQRLAEHLKEEAADVEAAYDDVTDWDEDKDEDYELLLPSYEEPQEDDLPKATNNPTTDENRHDCSLCGGIGTVTWGQPPHRTGRQAEAEELDTLRQFTTFIMVNLHDEMLTLTGDPKRMHRFGELKERVKPLMPITAR